jgi:DNA polymerase III subunit delta
MGALTFDALLRSLKPEGRAPDPVYYLYGDEDVLKDEGLQALTARVLTAGARDFNLDTRSAGDLSAAAFRTLVDTPPMLAPQRLVVLRGIEQMRRASTARQELLRYLAAPNPATVLVLVQSAGEKPEPELVRLGTAVAVEPLPPERVARWVAHRARRLGVTLDPEATAALLEAIGPDLGALAQELEKVGAATAGRAATRDDVAALVGVRRGETVQDLVAAVLERRAAAAARLVEPVLEQAGITGVRIVTALGTTLVGTALGRAELDRGTPRARLAAALLQHLRRSRPFGLGEWTETAARWAGWAEGWTSEELRRAMRRARDADRSLKSTTVTDERGIVTQLVLELGVLHREAA